MIVVKSSVSRGVISIVIPTYSGEDHIGDCLDSIASQINLGIIKEIILVIDGPNKNIESIVRERINKFKKLHVGLIIKKLATNNGRFKARLIGANLVTAKTILFIDDRTILRQEYLKNLDILLKDHESIISNIQETNHSNIASKTMFYIRGAMYRNWGESFDDYLIDLNNFGKSAKGTAGLVVRRNVFISACDEVHKTTKDTTNTSDDTKLLLAIIRDSGPILRTSKLTLYYEPRQKLREELVHVFERGPKFIDFYLQPKTRFFIPLIGFYTLVCLFIILIFVKITAGLGVVVLSLLFLLILAIIITTKPSDVLRTFLGLVFLISFFGAGLLKGLAMRVLR